ncbi:kinesin-related protein 4 isoform X2 [Sitodiplosis mosellana]|uniref:kinesin-related protein 4 isoform X2 n=1 Tax=Sitodiplosis mosellana TaxID=263140 RepID=UPI0024451D3B|nr:kinesin-related protein 4 isoform X2 [Sitodiplosis mosellana]
MGERHGITFRLQYSERICDTFRGFRASKIMAHIPKREPCKHCGLPVFFAERLAIDGSLYHRKCLRCARCDSQLTPGSFYETEVDGVFCCETCPDEEKKIRLDNNNVEHPSGLSTQVADEQRQSFSEKLAMFQSNGKGLLQKSLSDEEKSKSLKRLTELYSKNCTHDANDIKPTINESEDLRIDDAKNEDEIVYDIEASTFDKSDEEIDNRPPSLPKTLPPSLDPVTPVEVAKPKLPPIPSKANVLNKLYGKNKMEKVHQDNVKSNACTSGPNLQTQAGVSTSANGESSQIEPQNCSANEYSANTPSAPRTVPQIDVKKVNSIDNNLNTKNSLPLDALNSFTNVTKENAEFIEASQQSDNVHHLEDKRDSNGIDNDNDENDDDDKNDSSHVEQGINIKSVNRLEPLSDESQIEPVSDESNHLLTEKRENKTSEQNQEQEQEQEKELPSISRNGCNENTSIDTNIDKYDTNNLESVTDLREQSSSISDNDSQKMVRSRLSQFEALAQCSSELEQTPHHSPRLNRNSTAAENVERQCNEKKKSMNNDKINVTNATEAIVQLNVDVELKPSTRLSLNADDENNVNSNADSDKILNTLETNDFDLKKPVPRQRAALNVYLDEEANNFAALNPPTPSKRKQKPTASSEKLADKHQMVEDNSNNLDIQPKALPDNSLSSEDYERKKDETNYPNGLNPFGSDDEQDENDEQNDSFEPIPKRRESLNPFDSEDDEIELMKESTPKKFPKNHRVSTNPFGSDSENENQTETDTDSLSAKRTPVPTPRKPINGLQTNPDASKRSYNTLHPKMRLQVGDDLRGSDGSLASSTSNIRATSTLNRSSKIHGSMSSLTSTILRHKKGRAPDIPIAHKVCASASSSPSQSVRATPITRKKRTAPLPPKHHSMMKDDSLSSSHYLSVSSKLEDSFSSRHTISSESVVDLESSLNFEPSIESNYVRSSNDISMSSVEPSNFTSADFKPNDFTSDHLSLNQSTPKKTTETAGAQRKLIPVDESLWNDLADTVAGRSITEIPAVDDAVTYRRKIIPDQMITPIKTPPSATDRQCEKMKENKESQNKNRQSQIVLPTNVHDESSQMYSPNKSSYGKWKRRKGPAPTLPIPPRKVIQMLPLQEIRHELEVIEVQQQGLEKQGIMLEKMIRERCEGTENENLPLNECKPNSKEVEDLILQLFELVNEKNELFRRQAELMYLRRQHRLEQEQADIEYEIRVLMAQPEYNKTDSDKTREEALISRLVDVVQLRNEVIESLEMDRIREAEEDQSIKERLELHSAKRDEELCQQTPVKLSKKEKKKQKESKKLAKQKKVDADKDADESEISQSEKSKEKKKKKKFLF